MAAAATNLARTRVLVVGGSYAGLAATLNLIDLCNGRKARGSPSEKTTSMEKPNLPIHITVVDERDGFFHLIGSPLALATETYARTAWVPYSEIPALKHSDITWLQGRVSSIDPTARRATITRVDSDEQTTHDYDYLVATSGLRRVWPTVPAALKRKKWLLEADGHIQSVKNSKEKIVVIGAGAVGIEMAAELKLVQPDAQVVLVHSRHRVLSAEELPDDMAEQTRKLIEESGVEILFNKRVETAEPLPTNDGTTLHQITFTDGTQMRAGHVISAVSKPTPTSTYLPAAALNEEGLVKINNQLQFTGDIPNKEYHYCAGDLIAWSGIKRCGAAMYGGAIAASNIYQQMVHTFDGTAVNPEEMPFIPPMIALAVGKMAIAYHPETGIRFGTDVMENFFQDDLGFKICYNIMGLGSDSYKGKEEVPAAA